MRLLARLLAVAAVLLGLQSEGAPEGDIHAVIVAGSVGWWNYRHQADACHAYHTLRQHGVSAENIIVMMADDIAWDKRNPYQGQLYNRPFGENVYRGVRIDYSGLSVSPENFLSVLRGDADKVYGGNGRVLRSKPNDRIFIYYTDHGSVGFLDFPFGLLTVKELSETLNWMYLNNKYSKLVFYVEACHSGSMFDTTLSDNINVYAVTAAHRNENSYATYCGFKRLRLPCLGDEFSVGWMEDSDAKDINIETLEEQYNVVKRRTRKSHVQRYGDMNLRWRPVGWFQGGGRDNQPGNSTAVESSSEDESWPAFDVELLWLHQLMESTNDPKDAKQIEQNIQRLQDDRRNIESIYVNLVDELINDAENRTHILEEYDPVTNLDCHDDVVRAFNSVCVNFNKFEYALKYTNVLNNLCVHLGKSDVIVNAMTRTCSKNNSRFL